MRWWSAAIALGLGAASMVLGAGRVSAASSYTVASTADGPVTACVVNVCPNFRSAISAADGDSGSTITLTSGSTYAIASALPAITAPTTVQASTTGLRATIDGGSAAHNYRVLTASSSALTLKDLVITHGSVSGAGAQRGGGIITTNTALTLTNVLVTVNSLTTTAASATYAAAHGAGIEISQGSLTMTGGGITNNTMTTAPLSTDGGGGVGIDIDHGSATLVNVSVTGNLGSASADLPNSHGMRAGGVNICCTTADQLSMTGGTVSSNTVSSGDATAGGIFICCGAGGSLTGTAINDNTLNGSTVPIQGAGAYGGGLATCCGSAVTVTGATITGNKVNALAPFGGGVAACCNGSANGVAVPNQLTIRNSTVSGNTINGDQGFGAGVAMCCDTSVLTVTGSTIDHNHGSGAGSVGGGVGACCGASASTGSVTTIANSTIAFNTLSGSGSLGGGVGNADAQQRDITSSVVQLDNVTVNGNAAASGSQLGTGSPHHTITLVNTIVAGAGAGNCHDSPGAQITSQGHNLDDGNACGFATTGDIAGQDPKLGPLQFNAPGTTATEAITQSSPAFNAASDTSCPVTDQRGVTRVTANDPVCDIGAYEAPFTPTIEIPDTGSGGLAPAGLVLLLFGSALTAMARLSRRRRNP